MSRSIINVLGVLATLGVLALGILLVAMPLGFQALEVFGQTAAVVSTNASFQAQIDTLGEEEDRLGETQASVVDLQTQITPQNQLDDVFEVIATAAETAGVTITSVTAGDPVAFVERTSATAIDEVAGGAEQPAAPTADATPTDATAGAANTDTAAPADSAPLSTGRTQVDFAIAVTASDLDQVTAFLDALRAGPRLLGQVQTTVTQTGTGFDVAVTGLTFVLTEEG